MQPMKKTLALAFLISSSVPAFAQSVPPVNQWTNVYTSIRATFQNAYDIQDGAQRIFLNVNTYGNGLSFSGQPFSGSMNAYGNGWSLYAGGVSADISSWGGNTSINAQIPGRNGVSNHPNDVGSIRPNLRRPEGLDAPTRFLRLTMYAQGPANDPNFPPSYSIYDSDCSLQISPAGANGYTINGRVNTAKFGPEGTAIVGLTISALMQNRKSKTNGFPKPGAVEMFMRSDGALVIPAR